MQVEFLCQMTFNNYVMKTIISGAKSCEEHDETKYSPIGQTNNSGVTDPFVLGCRRNYGKGMKIEMNNAFR